MDEKNLKALNEANNKNLIMKESKPIDEEKF